MLDKVKTYKNLGYNFKLILEHEEVDIYNLPKDKLRKHPNTFFERIDRPNKTHTGHKKWRWMNNANENYKVPIDEI